MISETQIDDLENEFLEYMDVNNPREHHLAGISQVLITMLRNQSVDYKNCRELTKKQTFQNLQLNSEIKELEQKNERMKWALNVLKNRTNGWIEFEQFHYISKQGLGEERCPLDWRKLNEKM